MSNQQVTPFQQAQQPETLQSLLAQENYRKRFEQVLGVRAPQFISSILSLGSTMKDVEPRSVIAAAATAAALNLPIDKNLGMAWIIPYSKNGKKLASFQMGYHGLINLAQRTGAYERLNAEAINAEAYKGRDSVGEPIIDWDLVDPTKPVAGYAFAFKMINGFTKIAYWSKEKVESHAKRYSQSYRGGFDSPWKTHPDQMSLKVVIANELRRWGMLSVEMQGAFSEDHAIHRDIDAPAEFPEAADDISRPKFDDAPAIDAETSRRNEEHNEKQLAAAGLAPASPAEQPRRGRKKVAEAQSNEAQAAAPAPVQQAAAPVTPTSAQAPVPAPTPAPAASLFQSPAYTQLRTCMTSSGVTDAELIQLCRHRGVMTQQQEELMQLSDATLTDLTNNWTIIAGQVRQDRRRTQ